VTDWVTLDRYLTLGPLFSYHEEKLVEWFLWPYCVLSLHDSKTPILQMCLLSQVTGFHKYHQNTGQLLNNWWFLRLVRYHPLRLQPLTGSGMFWFKKVYMNPSNYTQKLSCPLRLQIQSIFWSYPWVSSNPRSVRKCTDILWDFRLGLHGNMLTPTHSTKMWSYLPCSGISISILLIRKIPDNCVPWSGKDG
jgi:hypothetical protein